MSDIDLENDELENEEVEEQEESLGRNEAMEREFSKFTESADKPTEANVEEELANVQGELTIEHLRKLPGADQYTDEQLMQMWQSANAPAPKRSYKIYNESGEVNDLADLSAEDFLKLQFGYNAFGKEHKKTFDELMRNASLAHYNEQKMAGLRGERQQLVDKYSKIEQEHTAWANDRKIWEHALTQLAMGNAQPIQQLAQAFMQAQQQMPAMEQAPGGDKELESAGLRVYYEYIVPNAQQVAQRYGANPEEVAQAVMHLVGQEPEEFLTAEKLANIINIEIPALLEQAGYSASESASNNAPSTPSNKPDKVSELEKKVAELTARLENQSVQKAKAKRPPPVGSGAAPSAGNTVPDFKSRREMKEWLQS